MAITKSMMNFVSPIISKHLETGGRSSSTVTTDYGGIGDALAKKAQMEYNMATFKADMQMRMADSKAANELQILDIEDRRIDKELADRKASQDMGDMEKVMGVLQGAASGAQAGMAAGGPKGAIVGGVLGAAGGVHNVTSGKPGDEKRADTENYNKTMGAVATIATSARGMYDDMKGKKAFEKGSKRLGEMRQGIESMAPGPEKEAAIAEYGKVKASISGEVGGRLGIEAGNAAAEGFTKGESAHFSKDPEERFQADAAQISAAMVSDPGYNDPATRSATRQKYYDQLQAATQRRHGYDDTKGSVSPQEFMAYEGAAFGGRPQSGQYGGQAGSTGGVGGAQGVPNPADGDSINQDPSYSGSTVSVPGFAGGTFSFPTGGGGAATYDDDGSSVQPVSSEQKLTQMGGPAAEAFRETQGKGEQQSENAPRRINDIDEMVAMIKEENPNLSDRQARIIAEDEMKGDHDGDGSVDTRDGQIAAGQSNANVPPADEYNAMAQDEANNQGTVKEKGFMDKFRETRDGVLGTAAKAAGISEKSQKAMELDDKGKSPWGGKGGNKETMLNAPTKVPPAEKAEIKKMSGEFQKVDQELNKKLEGAKSAGFANQGGDVTAKNIKNANEGYNATVPLIGRLPHGSQVKSVAAELYMNGAKGMGGAELLTTPIGQLLGGGKGAIIGNVLSHIPGLGKSEVAKLQGSRKTLGEILTKDEMDALDEYKTIKAAQIAPIVKTDDNGAIQNSEEVRAYSQQINFGQSLAAQYRTVLQGKKNLMTKAGSEEWASTGARQGIEMTQKSGARATAAEQLGKVGEESYLRETYRQKAKLDGGQGQQYDPDYFKKLSQ